MKSKIEDDKIYTSKSLTEKMKCRKLIHAEAERALWREKTSHGAAYRTSSQRFSRRNKSKACAATFDLVKSSYTVSDV